MDGITRRRHGWGSRVGSAYLAAASALFLAYRSFNASRQSRSQPASSDHQTFSGRVKTHTAEHGGWQIFASKLLRLISTSTLFALVVFTTLVPSGGRESDLLWIPFNAALVYRIHFPRYYC